MAPEPARLIDTGAVQQPVKPGVEAVGAAQRGQVTPGSDERLLDGVLGLIGVAQDEPGGGIEPEERGVRERGEGVVIASARSLHEFLLHLAPWQWHDRDDRAHRIRRGDAAVRSIMLPGRLPSWDLALVGLARDKGDGPL